MQAIDPADKRRPNVQIAASIRAAVLNGELEPGSQLPPGHELAKFFGVSRMTIQTAVRTLSDEGFLRSRTGSGVLVRDQASLPDPSHDQHPLAGTAAFLFEMGHLKQVARAGWLLLGIPQPEALPSTRSASPSSASPSPHRKALTSDAPQPCAFCTTRQSPGSATSPRSDALTSARQVLKLSLLTRHPECHPL
jgi:DNA-binding transcriptional regulator YhcF (GntR family)